MTVSRKIGYLRVSTGYQDGEAQRHALTEAGCEHIFEDEISGTRRERPGLAALMKYVRHGDTVTVVRSDRLARSLKHMEELLDAFEGKGVQYISLSEPFYDGSATSKMIRQILGSVGEFERNLASERSKEGQAAARAQGREPGNPGLKNRDPGMLRKLRWAQKDAYVDKIVTGMDDWWPTVKRLRPHRTWADTVRTLNYLNPDEKWTVKRLRRYVGVLVKQGIVEDNVLARTRKEKSNQHLAAVVAAMKFGDGNMTLWAIARKLEEMRELTPQGNRQWHPSQVSLLIKEAEDAGLLPKRVKG